MSLKPIFRRLSLLQPLVLLSFLAMACSPDTPTPVPSCFWPDSCGADATSDGQIGDSEDVTQTQVRALVFSVVTQKGEVLKGDVTTAKIDQSADKDPGATGIQVDVSVTTENVPDGATVEIQLDGKTVAIAAQILNNHALVSGVTVRCTTASTPVSLSVRAIVDAAKSDAAVGKDKSLTVTCGTACVATVDALPQSCLTQDQDPKTPGFQQTFFVHSDQSDCTDAYLQVTGMPGIPTETQHVLLNGSTSVAVTATLAVDDTGLIGVTATVVGVVEDTNNPDRGSVKSQPVNATITTENPTVVLLAPAAGQVKLTDDTDPLTPGVQVKLTGMVTALTPADKNAIELSIDGTVTATTTLQIDGQFVFPLSFTTSGTHALQVRATNSCGLTGQKLKSLAVFVDQAGLTIVAPTQDAILRAVDDLNKNTPDVLDTVLSVAVTAETAGADLQVFCKPTAAQAYPVTPTATLLYADSTLTTVDIPLQLPVAQLGQSVQCKVVDDSPNAAQSPAITFVVALPPPCLTVMTPTPTANLTVTTASVDFLLQTTGLDGQPIVGYLVTPGGVPLDAAEVGTPTNGHLSGKFLLQDAGVQVPDGTYALSFQGADKYGNIAGQSLCSDVTRTVTLDTTGPTLVITLPVKATLTTLDDPDSNPQKPGYQVDVEVTITDTHSICLLIDGVQFACNPTVPDGATTMVFHDVTLQPGLNLLAVTGSDIHGNTAAPPPTPVTLISDLPVVKFVQPPGSLKIATDSLPVTVSVASPLDGTPVLGASLEVLVNGLATPVTATDLGNGMYSFVLTGFSSGVTTLQAGAFVPSAPDKKGYSSEITVTFKNVKPDVLIVTPTTGEVLNVANLTCALGQTDCVLQVTGSLTNVEDGSPVQLNVTCGTKVTATNGQAKNGAITFNGVVLADQNSCDLSLAVTDASGQTAVSPVVTVTVDRVAPAFGNLTSPTPFSGLTLLALNDLDNDPTNGMQVVFTIEIAGIPAGATLTCDVLDDLGKPAGTYTGKAAQTVPDTVKEQVSLGVVTLPNGYNIKITCGVQDLAANATQKVLIAQVLSDLPQIHLTTPYPNADPCATSADCAFGGLCYQNVCTVAWNSTADRSLHAVASGLPDGAAVRLCTNAAGVTGTACATAGYVQVASATIQQSAATFSLNGQPDGIYRVMIEAFDATKNTWVNSLSGAFTNGKERRLLIDTVAPAVATLVPPTLAGVPATCLANAEQTVADGLTPGGKFNFQINMASEDATVTLLVNGVPAGNVTTSGKTGSAAVTIASEGTVTFETVSVDLVGNVSDPQQFPSLLVDTLPPTADFATPSKSPIVIGDSRDVQVVSVADDVEGEPVTVKDLGIFKATQAFLNGTADFLHATFGILSDGDHTLTADLRDHCANVATIGTQPTLVAVDTAPPTLNVTAPSEGALFTDSDDASPGQSGYQVAMAFSTTGATTWALELGTDCDAGSLNCAGFQPVGNGTLANPGGAEPPVLITVPFGNTVHYKFRLTVKDPVGNSVQATRGFDVLLSGCLVKLTGLPNNSLLNTQNCATPGQNCASVPLSVTASYVGPCGTPTAIQLQKGGVAAGSAVPVGQSASFNVVISDGDNTTLEAVVLEGLNQKGASGKLGIAADLSNPTVSFAAATVLGSPTVSGTTATQGKSQDLSSTSPDHEVHFQLALADAHLNGGALTALTRTAGPSTVTLPNSSVSVPVTLSGTSQSLDVQFASLLVDQLNTVSATVTDSFGNTGTATIAVTVDWQAPAAITLDPITVFNPRRPSVNLTFQAVGDSGVTGTATSYVVHYAKKPITNQADFDAACDASQIAGYQAVTPTAAGTPQTISISGPDGRNPTNLCKFIPFTDNGLSSYYFAVEAVDASGNPGPMSNVVSTDKLRLNYMRITNSGGVGSTFDSQAYRARVFGLGDLNGDGFAEIGLGGSSGAAGTGTSTLPFCILYGRAGTADIDLATEPASGLQCLTNSGGLAGSVAPPADVNGDGITDLVVGAKTGSGTPREIWVYLGNKNAQLTTTPAVIITGFTNPGSNSPGPFKLNTGGNFNGDVSASGHAVMDIVGTTRKDLNYSNSETVVLIPGNTGWANGSTLTIDINNSLDRTNNNLVRVRVADATATSALFGQYVKGANVIPENGGVGQQFDELVISQQATNQQIYVVKGRALSGPLDLMTTIADTGIQPNDADTVRLLPAGTGAQSFASAFDFVEFDGQVGADLLIQHQTGNAVDKPGLYWARGSGITAKFGLAPNLNTVNLGVVAAVTGFTDLFTTGGGYLSWSYVWSPLNIGNFFDDPSAGTHTDVMYARPTFTGATGGGQQMLIRMAVPRTESGGEIGFVYEDLILTDPFVPTNAAFGFANWAMFSQGFSPVGDFNKDGLVDLVIGSGDTAGAKGSTLIVY